MHSLRRMRLFVTPQRACRDSTPHADFRPGVVSKKIVRGEACGKYSIVNRCLKVTRPTNRFRTVPGTKETTAGSGSGLVRNRLGGQEVRDKCLFVGGPQLLAAIRRRGVLH